MTTKQEFNRSQALALDAAYKMLLAENARLRALLTDAPVLVIDASVAKLLGEDIALAYRDAVLEWHPKVRAALEQGQVTNGKD